MVKDCFNLSGSIISCRDMQANAGIWCPMHLARVGDFSLACSSVKAGLART
jgi:hypothetical protein